MVEDSEPKGRERAMATPENSSRNTSNSNSFQIIPTTSQGVNFVTSSIQQMITCTNM